MGDATFTASTYPSLLLFYNLKLILGLRGGIGTCLPTQIIDRDEGIWHFTQLSRLTRRSDPVTDDYGNWVRSNP